MEPVGKTKSRKDRRISEQILPKDVRDAVVAELRHSAKLLRSGVRLGRRVLILGGEAQWRMLLLDGDAIEDEVVNAAAVQLAMIMTSASAFVLTWRYVDDDDSAWFATCGVTRGASAGIIAPLDSAAGPELSIWGPELHANLANWLPPPSYAITSDVNAAMRHAFRPGGLFEMTRVKTATQPASIRRGIADDHWSKAN